MIQLAHRAARIGIMAILIMCVGCPERVDTPTPGNTRDSSTMDTSEIERDTGSWNGPGDTASHGCGAISETADWELCSSEPRTCTAVGTDSNAIVTHVGEDDGHGSVESHGDLLLGWAFIEERGSVFNPSDFYVYAAEETTHLMASIQAGAGVR